MVYVYVLAVGRKICMYAYNPLLCYILTSLSSQFNIHRYQDVRMCTILTVHVVAILEKVLFHSILALVKGQMHHQSDLFLD